MGRRTGIIATVAVCIAMLAIAVARFHTTRPDADGASATGAGWRAEPTELVARIEHLADAGEADAAASVLAQLLKRDGIAATGLDDRARMAAARGYLKAKRTDEALAQVAAIPWADKSRAVAAQILGLELAIRWQGLFDRDGHLAPAALGPRLSPEAPQGLPKGAWLQRWEHYRALAELIDRGAHMVSSEGGAVAMPASAAMMQLARHDHGDLSESDFAAAMGPTRDWQPELALAMCRLRLQEYAIPEAIAAAEALWSGHPASGEAAEAYHLLRVWQLERGLASGHLPLWRYPEVDARLDALATIYKDAARSADIAVARIQELNQWGMASAIAAQAAKAAKPLLDAVETAIPTAEIARNEDAIDDRPERRVFALALAWNGLELASERREVPLGEPATLTITSVHRGPHTVRIHRLPNRKTWDVMCTKPSNALLPAEAVHTRELQGGDWSSLGEPCAMPFNVDGLGEGFYVATVAVRGCPTTVLTGFVVVDPDLYVIAGRDEVVTWVVSRASGKQKSGEPLRATMSLVRDPAQAAGSAWDGADPVWRAGFTEAFTDEPSAAFVTDALRPVFAAGRTAGLAASATDPPFSAELDAVSGEDGIGRVALPVRLRDRSYTVAVSISRPDVMVRREARVGPAADWTAKAVAWADRPLVRPGETVHWKMLMRDLDGYSYRLPVGEIELTLRLDDQVLWSGTQAITDAGTVGGELAIPPGAAEGRLTVSAGTSGPRHALAGIERAALPSVRYDVIEDETSRLRAGESIRTGIGIHDAAGEPIAGVEVTCSVTAYLDGVATPCPQPGITTSDVAGIAHVVIATIPDAQALYRAYFSFTVDHHRYRIERSWQASTFPFPLEAVVRNRQLSAVDSVRVELRFPAEAQVTVRLVRGEQALGEDQHPRGAWPLWCEAHVPLDRSTQNADAVEVSTAVAGGGRARLRIPITIAPPPISAGAPEVQLSPDRLRVEPEQTLGLTLGVNVPGRDVLLVGGSRSVQLLRTTRLDTPAHRVEVAIASDWAPNISLQAVAYLPIRGFTATSRQDIEVSPVDRLLRVVVTPEREDYHPGDDVAASVLISDWKGRPAGGVSVSIGVVNELIYQLADDATPDLWTYFYGYRRAYGLVEGTATALPFPSASLWHGVAWRWQSPEGFACIGSEMALSAMNGARYGGGRARSISRGGGASASEAAMLALESGVAIAWVGDLRTDADGRATIRFTMPANTGRFRCTARASSTDAQLMVGEVRMGITSRQPFGCALRLPETAREGDVVQAELALASYDDAPLALALELPDGSRRELTLPGRARRALAVPVRIAAGDGEIRVAGGQVGRVVTLRASAVAVAGAAKLETRIVAAAHCLVIAAGIPRTWSGLVSAGADGSISLPWPVPEGAALRVRCRAWPDASARRDALAASARAGVPAGAVAALAWLEAPAGERRARALATCWSTLDKYIPSALARQAAARRGEAFGSLGAVPDGVDGDWLLARGRFDGLLLGAPRERGHVASAGSDRIAAVAIALAESWPEGHAWWPGILQELDRASDGQGTDPTLFSLALGIDAARMAGDESARTRLAARLGRLPWTCEFDQALALVSIPSGPGSIGGAVLVQDRAGVGAAAATDIATLATIATLDAGAASEWLGVAGPSFTLSSTPGALADLEVLMQTPAPLQAKSVQLSATFYERCEDGGYTAVPAGRALWPGRPLAMAIASPQMAEVVLRLPSLLRIAPEGGEFLIVDAERSSIRIDGDIRLAASLLEGGDRDGALASFFSMCQRNPVLRTGVGQRLPVHGADSKALISADGTLSLSVWPGQPTFIALATSSEGTAAWPPLAITGTMPGAQERQQELPSIVVGVGDIAPLAAPEIGLPARALARLRHLAADASTEDLSALLLQMQDLDVDDDPRIALLDRHAAHDPAALLAHPLSGVPGHWSTAALRAWSDGDLMLAVDTPTLKRWLSLMDGGRNRATGLQDVPDAGAELVAGVDWTAELAHPTMRTLILLAEADAALRREIEVRLPTSMATAPRVVSTARDWFRRLGALGLAPARDYDTWVWEQELDADLQSTLGYPSGVDGWVAFLRTRCGLEVRIGTGVPVEIPGIDQVSGPRLGASLLTTCGYALQRVGPALEIRPARGFILQEHLLTISIDVTDERLDTVVADLDTLLANRGLPPLEVDPAFHGGDTRVTFACKEADWRNAVTSLASVIGATVAFDGNHAALRHAH